MDATVLFSDLRGFTAFAEAREPEQVIEVLNRYLTAMSDAILDHGGTLVAYMGDGIMAVFGAPVAAGDHADRALDAARAMLARLEEFNAWMREDGLGDGFKMGIGLHSGPVMSGNVGSARRLEYAAIGDTTNTAARLEGMTKGTPYQLFVGEPTRDRLAAPPDELEFVSELEVRGRERGIRVWGLAPDPAAATLTGPCPGSCRSLALVRSSPLPRGAGGEAQGAAGVARRHRRRAAEPGRHRRVGPDGRRRRRVRPRRVQLARHPAGPGAPPDFSTSDAVVAAAVARGLSVLPVVAGTPDWAAVRPGDIASPPRDLAACGRFLTRSSQRYGPAGTLWAERPDLPRHADPHLAGLERAEPHALLGRAAVRAAPTSPRCSAARPGPPRRRPGRDRAARRADEQELDRAARRSTRRAAAGGSTRSRCTPTRAGRGTSCGSWVARREMRKRGDGELPIWVTELSWPAAKGKVDAAGRLRGRRPRPAARLGARPAAAGEGPRSGCGSAGLLVHVAVQRGRPELVRLGGAAPRPRPARASPRPALTMFQRAARRLEGCAKVRGDARRCAA